MLVVKTDNEQILGAYGYLHRWGKFIQTKNFYFNITNKELSTSNISFKLNNEEISVNPYFKLGKGFFKSQNNTYKNYNFCCKEVEVFEIDFQ